MLRVLLVDSSAHFPANPLLYEGLQKLAAEHRLKVELFDEASFIEPLQTSYLYKLVYKGSHRRFLPSSWAMNRGLLGAARRFRPDVVLIVKGMFLAPETLGRIKEENGAILINYATDDPFNQLVNNSMLVEAIRFFDVYACTKRAIIDDVKKAGCSRAVFVPFGYKPTVHFPEDPKSDSERARFAADVTFLGTCDRDRVPIINAIRRARPELRLHLYGAFWNRHPSTRPCSNGLVRGRDVRLAFRGAKIVINLVRRANRDMHGPRTFEIPACGAFMLTDRTDEQREFLAEDKEAVFFSSIDEMNDKISYYLKHDSVRRSIAEAGYRRIIAQPNTYEDRAKSMLQLIGG